MIFLKVPLFSLENHLWPPEIFMVGFPTAAELRVKLLQRAVFAPRTGCWSLINARKIALYGIQCFWVSVLEQQMLDEAGTFNG